MAVTGSISIRQNSQNIAKNTTSITVTGTATMSGPSYDLYTRTGTVTIDGKDYSFSTIFPGNSTKTIFSKTVSVEHNSEGKKTVSASFSIKTGMTGTLPNGVLSKSTSKTLTTIPRTSNVSLSRTNFNIGKTITIYTNRASSSFTHTAVIKFNGKTVRKQTGIGSRYSWSTTELYKYVPNDNRATGTVTLTTYSGSTKIGTSSESFTANVTKSNPTFKNFDVKDVNSLTLNLTGNKNKYIKKYSNAKVTISSANKMVSKNSATSKSYNVVAGNSRKTVNYSSSSNVSATINNINSNTISVFAIDSRNNQASVTKSLDVIDYSECILQSINVQREGGIGTSIVITASGRYSNINFGKVTNSIKAIEFRKKKKSLSTWEDWQSILYLFEIDTENGRFNSVEKIYAPTLGEFELGVEYDVQVRVKDELSEDVETLEINSGTVLWSAVKDKGVCFGGIYDINKGGALQVIDPIDKVAIDLANKIVWCEGRINQALTFIESIYKRLDALELGRTTLFSDSGNSSNVISLSDSAYNYSYLYIRNRSNYYVMVPIYADTQTALRGIGGWSGAANVGSTHFYADLSNSGRLLRVEYFRAMVHESNSNHNAGTDYKVTLVVGVK